jgi:hypothetical protein
MPAAQLADLGLNLGGQARGTVPRPAGAIQQTGHALLLEPPPPAVQGLARGSLPLSQVRSPTPGIHGHCGDLMRGSLPRRHHPRNPAELPGSGSMSQHVLRSLIRK